MARVAAIRAIAGYVLAFTLARGALFAAPLLLANLLPLELYGRVEFAQSVASLLTVVVGLGLPFTVPLILLRDEVTQRWDTLLFLMLALAAALAATVLGLALLTGAPMDRLTLIPLFTLALLLQGFWASVLKSRNRSNLAVFAESGFWLAILAGAALAVLAGQAWWTVALAALGYAAALFTLTARRFARQRQPFSAADLIANLRLGLPLVATTLLSTLLMVVGRVVLGAFGSDLAVATYAILFRATSIALVVHQLLTIAFYQRLFLWNEDNLRRRTPAFVLGVAAFVLVFLLLVDPLGWLLGQQFARIWATHRLEGALLLTQTILWTGIALNDFLTTRLHIALPAAKAAMAFLALGIPALLALVLSVDASQMATLLRLTILGHMALLGGYFLVQCAVIRARGHDFTLLWGATTGLFAALLGLVTVPLIRL